MIHSLDFNLNASEINESRIDDIIVEKTGLIDNSINLLSNLYSKYSYISNLALFETIICLIKFV